MTQAQSTKLKKELVNQFFARALAEAEKHGITVQLGERNSPAKATVQFSKLHFHHAES